MHVIYSVLDFELKKPFLVDLLDAFFGDHIIELFNGNFVQDKGLKLSGIDDNFRSFIDDENGSLRDGSCKACSSQSIVDVRDDLHGELDFHRVPNCIYDEPCNVV